MKIKFQANAIDSNTIITMDRKMYRQSVPQCISTNLSLKSATNLYTKLTKKQFSARLLLQYHMIDYKLCFHISLFLYFVVKFNLTCEENEWKLTLIGTVKMSAELIMLPLSGLLSDRCVYFENINKL